MKKEVSETWQHNIQRYRSILEQDQGPKLVNIVSGSTADREYWQDRLELTRRDVFRCDGDTMVVSSHEKTRKGNFLGSINAWLALQKAMQSRQRPPVTLMNMVFGLGKRLSPFTQALTNRKPAFPTPMKSSYGDLYLSTVDAASMSATLWLHHLESHGFRGIVVKWGDEAVIPGKLWQAGLDEYEAVDGIRFVWQTEPTEDLAREKEWVEFEAASSKMTYQFTRQGLDGLRKRLAGRGRDRLIGVNLGSLGISYRLMEVAEEVFMGDLLDEGKWVDWDPYTWIALACPTEAEWRAEAAFENGIGKTGIRELEARFPYFYGQIKRMRDTFQERYGRQPIIKVLDFGQPFWMDWGLHLSLRRSMEALISDTDLGITTRELFQLPHECDQHGNILLRSSVPSGADIRNSLLVDTLVTEKDTVIRGGVVVAGRHGTLTMPDGGAALFCAADRMQFNGPHAIAFKVIDADARLAEGDRSTCLFYSDSVLGMRSNESIIQYEGENYSQPVMGNPISFEEATRRMFMEDTRLVEKRWFDEWSQWGR